MLEDVLAALAGAPVDRVVVVTPDAEVAAVAERWGALVVREPEGLGHTGAGRARRRAVPGVGRDGPAHRPRGPPLPHRGRGPRILEACGPAPAAVFVPSRSGLGTNAACLAPPDAVPLRFGEPSFADHLAAARARGIEPVVLALPGAGLDIDRPEDLTAAAPGRHRRRGRPPSWRPSADSRDRRARPALEVFGIRGLPELRPGDDLAALALRAARAQGTPLESGDVVVLSQKAVSKTEGRLVRLADVIPSALARRGRTRVRRRIPG